MKTIMKNNMGLNLQLFAEQGVTKIENLIDPEVMAPMISAKLEKAIVVTPFAKIDTTLVNQPGDTITVPKYAYIGDAEDVAEGVEAGTVKLTATKKDYKVKKAVKAVTLQKATLVYDAKAPISYEGVVDGIDLFQEEVNTDKVMFVSPSQVTTLRKDENFISADKYNNNVIMKGEIGMIANARIVPSRRITLTDNAYLCPIVQLNPEEQTDDDTSALTIYLKRDTQVETERHAKAGTTDIVANKHYVAALTDESKVVIAKFTA